MFCKKWKGKIKRAVQLLIWVVLPARTDIRYDVFQERGGHEFKWAG